jgi:hypothetical protein
MITGDRKFDDKCFPVTETGCWLWTGAVTPWGYGKLGRNNRTIVAHRFMWQHVHGDIPEGMFVMHKCDVPACVNPQHLMLGNAAANSADMVAKGRQAHGDRAGSRVHIESVPRADRHWTRRMPGLVPVGEANPAAKLTAAAVRAIRADKRTHRQVAAAYGVSMGSIENVRARRTWKHVE